MAEKRMACWNCPRYDRADKHCLDGKTNPRNKADTVVVAETLGLRALCHYNPHRDALALRTHFPTHPAARVPVRPRTRRNDRRTRVEIEIE